MLTTSIGAVRVSEHSQVVAGIIPGGLGSRGSGNDFVRRLEIIAQGRPLPKRDIVDTYFHASCAARQCTATGSLLPTTWGNGNSRKQGPRVTGGNTYLG